MSKLAMSSRRQFITQAGAAASALAFPHGGGRAAQSP
jgi:hypothetical protein